MGKRRSVPDTWIDTLSARGLRVSARLAAAMLEWSSDDAYRSGICGLAAHPMGYLAATDGHRALRVWLPAAARAEQQAALGGQRGLWPRGFVAESLAVARQRREPAIDLPWVALQAGCTPPDLQAVWPDGDRAPRDSLDLSAAYLAAALPVARAIPGSSVGVRLLAAGHALDPVHIAWPGAPTHTEAIVMPMRL